MTISLIILFLASSVLMIFFDKIFENFFSFFSSDSCNNISDDMDNIIENLE